MQQKTIEKKLTKQKQEHCCKYYYGVEIFFPTCSLHKNLDFPHLLFFAVILLILFLVGEKVELRDKLSEVDSGLLWGQINLRHV